MCQWFASINIIIVQKSQHSRLSFTDRLALDIYHGEGKKDNNNNNKKPSVSLKQRNRG